MQPSTEFYRNKHTSDKLESQCKQCKRSALQNVTTPTVESKRCSKCNEVRAASCFDRYKRTSDGLQSQCKDCMKVWGSVVVPLRKWARDADAGLACLPAMGRCCPRLSDRA